MYSIQSVHVTLIRGTPRKCFDILISGGGNWLPPAYLPVCQDLRPDLVQIDIDLLNKNVKYSSCNICNCLHPTRDRVADPVLLVQEESACHRYILEAVARLLSIARHSVHEDHSQLLILMVVRLRSRRRWKLQGCQGDQQDGQPKPPDSNYTTHPHTH